MYGKTKETMTMSEMMLEVKNVSKSFGMVKALSNINLTIRKGEIYGLVGANGSGKSTLMNILFGNSVIEETGGFDGEVCIDGETVNIRSAKDSIQKGIGMIHQEFILIPEMSVSENINITRENTHPMLKKMLGTDLAYIEWKKDREDARGILHRLGFEVDETLLVKHLSVNAKQFVEIAREMKRKDLKVLLLDEPTAVLNEEDSGRLMDILKELAKTGISILFCTHRLHEICEICDRVSVIRDGREVSTYEKSQLNISQLARDMIGYDVSETKRIQTKQRNEKVLEVKKFSVNMPGEKLHQIDMDVYSGEIVGLTSLSGHGKLALGYGLMGMFPTEGEVLLKGEHIQVAEVQKNIEKGLFLLPDDRKNMGLLLQHSVKENIVFSGFYGKKKFTKKLFGDFYIRDQKAMDLFVENQIEKLEIKCADENQPVRELSGGNQQKVCIARANAMEPEVLVVMEPTRGVDIGAKEKILDLLVDMNEQRDTAILVASSELDELKRICDRIVIFCEGRVAAVLSPDASDEAFALAFTGEEEYCER